MKSSFVSSLFLLSLFGFVGCSSTVMSLLDVKATSSKITADKAYNSITSILVDKGFDVKIANKDIGLVTTEFKKFGSVSSGSTAFDLFLQIKTQVKNRPDGVLQIVLTPVVKEVNRLNSSAFTERELVFLSNEEQKGSLNALEKTNLEGQLLFMNVVQGISEILGLSMAEIEYNKKLSEVPSSFLKNLLK